MEITVVTADDEEFAREALAWDLSRTSCFHIIGEASNGVDAVTIINDKQPDVVFLDVNMPGKNGIQVATEIMTMEKPPLVVFVTAYAQPAVNVFDVNALDFLLKPYDKARFQRTIKKILHNVSYEVQALGKMNKLLDFMGQLRVSDFK